MGTVESGSLRCFFWHIAKSDQTYGSRDIGWNLKKTVKYFFNVNFHHQGGADPKVMGTIESGLSRRFFWHLAKSDRTYGSWDINWFWGGGTIRDKAVVAAAQNTILRLDKGIIFIFMKKKTFVLTPFNVILPNFHEKMTTDTCILLIVKLVQLDNKHIIKKIF